ncbi:MAG: hypothetical protein LBV43_00565 [Prevotella sp.]|jgi:hypothetical protein|nr:hypothetical protein [Prevotella sp.]
MKYYLLNTIQRVKQYSKQLDAESVLYNKNWIVFNDGEDKEQFIFRPNKELLISRNGIVSKAKWELLATGTILIEMGELTYLFNAAFKDNTFLILQLDGNKDYLIMYDHNLMVDNVIKSIQDIENQLDKRYIPANSTTDSKEIIIEKKSEEEIEAERLKQEKLRRETFEAKKEQKRETKRFIIALVLVFALIGILAGFGMLLG